MYIRYKRQTLHVAIIDNNIVKTNMTETNKHKTDRQIDTAKLCSWWLDRISIKLQLTGKSRLILQLYKKKKKLNALWEMEDESQF